MNDEWLFPMWTFCKTLQGQIKSLEEKIVELQSSLTEERQNSQKFGKYLEEGEHKLKKLRTEREKIRAKLVAEREAFKALTRGFEVSAFCFGSFCLLGENRNSMIFLLSSF